VDQCEQVRSAVVILSYTLLLFFFLDIIVIDKKQRTARDREEILEDEKENLIKIAELEKKYINTHNRLSFRIHRIRFSRLSTRRCCLRSYNTISR
jgi:hypothetical protein